MSKGKKTLAAAAALCLWVCCAAATQAADTGVGVEQSGRRQNIALLEAQFVFRLARAQ